MHMAHLFPFCDIKTPFTSIVELSDLRSAVLPCLL